MKHFSAVLLFLFASLLFGCSKNDSTSNSNGQLEDESMIQYMRENYGFTGSIVANNEFIIVDDEITFPKENFWDIYTFPSSGTSSHGEKQKRQPFKVTTTKTILVNVLGEVPTKWAGMIYQAMNEWNSLNGGIKFYGMSGTTNVNGAINVKYLDLGKAYLSYIAQGYPVGNDGKPGYYLGINSAYKQTLTDAEMKFTIVHELGHCIGFAHTDTNDGTLIVTTSESCNKNNDPNSIMHTGLRKWSGFTDCDKAAFKAMYP